MYAAVLNEVPSCIDVPCFNPAVLGTALYCTVRLAVPCCPVAVTRVTLSLGVPSWGGQQRFISVRGKETVLCRRV